MLGDVEGVEGVRGGCQFVPTVTTLRSFIPRQALDTLELSKPFTLFQGRTEGRNPRKRSGTQRSGRQRAGVAKVDDGKDRQEVQCKCDYSEYSGIRWFSSTGEVQKSREDRGVVQVAARGNERALSHATAPDCRVGLGSRWSFWRTCRVTISFLNLQVIVITVILWNRKYRGNPTYLHALFWHPYGEVIQVSELEEYCVVHHD